MAQEYGHISEQDLTLAADGELPRRRLAAVERHLRGCWSCRTRQKEIEETIANFAQAYRGSLDLQVSSSAGPRALFKARLARLVAEHPPTGWSRMAEIGFNRRRVAYFLGTVVIAVGILMLAPSSQPSMASSPNPQLTPGVTLAMTSTELCGRPLESKNREVLVSLGKQVFAEYGISNPPPHRYEMDYLIDPDLGGADDARNLWPQPYSALWNANLKDALEDHLRELVCTNKITLAQAQHDISADWIAAYKTYFHTEQPFMEHRKFRKDEPWE